MTPISERFAIGLALILLLAALPIAAAELWPRHRDPCAQPDGLRVTSLIPGSQVKGERNEGRPETVFQWSEGSLAVEGFPEPLEFHVVRGYREERLYLRPTALLALRMEPERHEILELDAGGRSLPVHLVRDDTLKPGRFALYLFVYGDDPVAHPFLAQLLGVPEDIVRGSRPLTLLMVGGYDERGGGIAQQRAGTWMADAWQHFDAFCSASG